MINYAPANAFRAYENYDINRYHFLMPPRHTFADLFVPTYWAHHRSRLQKGDIITVRSEDFSIDLDLTVKETPVGGVVMQVRPQFGGVAMQNATQAAQAAADDVRLKVVPFSRDGKPRVRVEWLAATNWRVIGLDGEISRDHKTEGDAIKSMEKYLVDNGLTMPSAEEVEKAEEIAKAEAQAASEAALAKKARGRKIA